MRRAGNLFEQIVALDNLRYAFQRAARGKRHRAEVAAFQITIDERLADMSARLQQG